MDKLDRMMPARSWSGKWRLTLAPWASILGTLITPPEADGRIEGTYWYLYWSTGQKEDRPFFPYESAGRFLRETDDSS